MRLLGGHAPPLDLHEMHVRRIGDAGIQHRLLHCFGDHVHLGTRADLLWLWHWREGAANGQALGAARHGRYVAVDAKHRVVRRQHPFGTAGKDKDHRLRDGVLRGAKSIGKQQLERKHQVAARVVVDQAITLGLADEGHDVCRVENAASDGVRQLRNVAGVAHGEAVNGRAHAVLDAGHVAVQALQLLLERHLKLFRGAGHRIGAGLQGVAGLA